MFLRFKNETNSSENIILDLLELLKECFKGDRYLAFYAGNATNFEAF